MKNINKLRTKINKFILLTFFCISIIFLFAQVKLQKNRKRNYINNTKIFLETIVKLNNKELVNEIFENRKNAIVIRLNQLLKINLIKSIYIYDKNKKVITYVGNVENNIGIFPEKENKIFEIKKNNRDEVLIFSSKIGFSDQTFGYLKIYYSLEQVNHAKFISYIIFFISILFFFIFMVGFQQYYLRKIFISPLIKLKDAMALISSKENMGTTVDIVSNDELGDLANSFNEMSLALKKSYDEIYQSKKRFEIIFDQTFQLIALLDKEGNVMEINRTSLELIGESENKYFGLPFWETPWWNFSEKDVEILKIAINKVKKGEFFRQDVRNFSKKGIILLDFSLTPIFNNEGNVIQMIAEGRDITEIKKTEAQLRQVQKMEMVGTLAGGLAHDFNNLLAGILGAVSLIKMKRKMNKELSLEKFDDYINIIEKSGDRATNLVQQLLTISRKQELNFTEVDLNYSIKNIIKMVKGSLDKSVEFDFEFGEPAIVKADPTQMEQVLLNLCVNAAHSMTIMREKDQVWGGVVKIEIDTFYPDKNFLFEHAEFVEKKYIKISIKDEGVGIDKQHLGQIFNPFFTTKEKGKGTGLGLSMVYNIIKQHDGYIYVKSQKNIGTVFDIYLPAVKSKVKTDTEFENSEIFDFPDGQGVILIIDDEEILRTTAKYILEEMGYKTILATNGKEGVEIYSQRKNEISLVLLDMVMPVMSGKDAYIALKKINPECKIILSSGFKQDERVKFILNSGVEGFLKKPYDFRDLAILVKEVLQ